MLIISGHLTVAPADRDDYVADCRIVVGLARKSPGCLDFAITGDSLDAGRVTVYERWETEEELEAFRGSGPDSGTADRILDASVVRYLISGSGPA